MVTYLEADELSADLSELAAGILALQTPTFFDLEL